MWATLRTLAFPANDIGNCWKVLEQGSAMGASSRFKRGMPAAVSRVDCEGAGTEAEEPGQRPLDLSKEGMSSVNQLQQQRW